jgi:hypothetical protein
MAANWPIGTEVMLEFAYNESAPNCLTGRVGERFWVNGPGTPDWAAVANIAGAQGYLPRRFLRLAPAPPPPPVPEPGPNRQRMALAVVGLFSPSFLFSRHLFREKVTDSQMPLFLISRA